MEPKKATKPKTKKQQAEEIGQRLLLKDGFKECEKCSTEDWKIYHSPGKCP